MKNLFVILFIIVFFMNSLILPAYGYSMMADFLCETGIEFYQKGRYDEALNEFQKALMVKPDYATALKYIEIIKQRKLVEEKKEEVTERPLVRPEVPKVITPVPESIELPEAGITPTKKISLPKILALDESLSQIRQPIEIEQGKSIIVLGENIQRFLATQPDILMVEKQSQNELLVTGKDVGYTYLHVWDDSGRWTLEFLTVPQRPEGPTLEEERRLEEERAHTFKLRYNMNWNSYEEGRRFDELGTINRKYYSWYHQLDLTGGTPYGEFDSRAIIRRLNKETDLTYFTLGLTDGILGNFKGFSMRGFDFTPPFSNIALGWSVNTRGIMLKSPAFNEKINYSVFWGREGGGRYANLSPGLAKIKNSFLEGIDVNYYPVTDMNYGFSVLRGHGRDRPVGLNSYGYDARANWNIDKWKLGYEIAYDSEKFAQVLNSNYSQPRFSLTSQLRNVNKDFVNISNLQSWRVGERGALFILNYTPTDDLYIYSNLDVYQDRTAATVDKEPRWNEDYDFNARYTIDPTTSLRFYYTLQNEIGKLNQLRYQSPGVGLNKTFNLIRPISTYIDYRHRQNTNFTGPSVNYINDSIIMGLRLSLVGELYYFANRQLNWLNEKFTDIHSRPQVFETGVDLNSQIGNSPFYENMRFTYRDEENAGSALGFLSGEDYIEGYNELSYKPGKDTEIYCSSRIRNVWADNPNVNKRIEFDFRAGLRYLWDTGIRWEGVGTIEGYVFRDLNSDALRQRDEAPEEGIKVWLGKDRSTTTDIFGYYKFTKVKGKKAFVTIDAQSLPIGFVLTVPQIQEAAIVQGKTTRVDFGIISRSEISGFVFYDVNGDGVFNKGDIGVKGATLTLENGIKVQTDSEGRYAFRNASIGEHTITLDLNSLPVYYLPGVPLTQKIELFEGVVYIYNIPLKKAQQ